MSVVVVSNRGPLSFGYGPNGELVTKRAAGGLASTLGSAIAGSGATWVAAAISDADREAAAGGPVEAEGFRVQSLVLDPDGYRMFYDVIANGTLWYLFHGLYDLPRRPRIDRRWREAWAAYREVNRAFATTTAEIAPEGAAVLVHDYHLMLVGSMLAEKRPDLRLVHFSHMPFCEPMSIRVLPEDAAVELFEGMAGYQACGFHSSRWAEAFEACSKAIIGRSPSTYVTPAAPDAADLVAVAGSKACAVELALLEERIGGRKLIVRVDRIELSKNLVRGFHAFEDLLRTRPELRNQVVFSASVYPSREGLADYLAYRQEVDALADRINQTWSTPDWTPIILDTSDNFARSVAALRRYDVLLVNPVRDGLNLVAQEGALVNERNGVLALSREAGVFDRLGAHALPVNPFDVAGTADTLATALAMPEDERASRAAALRETALAHTSGDWLRHQLAAAEGPTAAS
jgi:trehalose 6-phosphate synthase